MWVTPEGYTTSIPLFIVAYNIEFVNTKFKYFLMGLKNQIFFNGVMLMRIRHRICEYMVDQGILKNELAEKADIKPTTLHEIIKNPYGGTVLNLKKIAIALKIGLDDLLEVEGNGSENLDTNAKHDDGETSRSDAEKKEQAEKTDYFEEIKSFERFAKFERFERFMKSQS